MGSDIHGVFQAKVNNQWIDIESNYEEDRHYQLFVVLAGVRNEYGFAGVPTGEPVTPIASPRNFPADFDLHLDKHGDKWMGDHSHSYLSGEEMLDWYKNAPVTKRYGVITREQYNKWDKVSEPEFHSGDVYGGSVIKISDTDFDRAAYPNYTHIRVSWNSDLKKALAYFFNEVQRLVDKHGEIRYVFGFDA